MPKAALGGRRRGVLHLDLILFEEDERLLGLHLMLAEDTASSIIEGGLTCDIGEFDRSILDFATVVLILLVSHRCRRSHFPGRTEEARLA